MILRRISPGLFRWTAPHPDWEADASPEGPADWPRDVGCVLFEADAATVLIDPLLPPDRERFLRALDERIRRRAKPVLVLTTIGFHSRSRDELARRYRASTSRAKRNLPAGVESFRLPGAGETVYWLEGPRALVPGDRIIGAPGGGLRLCPESWMRYLTSGMKHPELKRALRPLLELPVERVLVSHGEPVLKDGRAALAHILG